MSFELWHDAGWSALEIPHEAPPGLREHAASLAGMAAASAKPPLVYLAMGSHAEGVGGDGAAEARYRLGFERFLRHPSLAGAKLLLALETARGLAAADGGETPTAPIVAPTIAPVTGPVTAGQSSPSVRPSETPASSWPTLTSRSPRRACLLSNLRIELRGRAATRALRAACPDSGRCRIVDLFQATLPHLFEPSARKHVAADQLWAELPLEDALHPWL